MNPVMIRVFDVKRNKTITNHVFDMHLTLGCDCGTAGTVFKAIEDCSMQLDNCVSLSLDSTNTMTDKHNSLASNTLKRNPSVFAGGCPCYPDHIAACHDHDSFSEFLDLNIEKPCTDLIYWLDKSSKGKGKLTEYFEFCEQEYKSILKDASVR